MKRSILSDWIEVDKKYRDFVSLVKMMRKAQKQWKNGDPFDGTEVELAKRMCEAEREVDEYLKKMEMQYGMERN